MAKAETGIYGEVKIKEELAKGIYQLILAAGKAAKALIIGKKEAEAMLSKETLQRADEYNEKYLGYPDNDGRMSMCKYELNKRGYINLSFKEAKEHFNTIHQLIPEYFKHGEKPLPELHTKLADDEQQYMKRLKSQSKKDLINSAEDIADYQKVQDILDSDNLPIKNQGLLVATPELAENIKKILKDEKLEINEKNIFDICDTFDEKVKLSDDYINDAMSDIKNELSRTRATRVKTVIMSMQTPNGAAEFALSTEQFEKLLLTDEIKENFSKKEMLDYQTKDFYGTRNEKIYYQLVKKRFGENLLDNWKRYAPQVEGSRLEITQLSTEIVPTDSYSDLRTMYRLKEYYQQNYSQPEKHIEQLFDKSRLDEYQEALKDMQSIADKIRGKDAEEVEEKIPQEQKDVLVNNSDNKSSDVQSEKIEQVVSKSNPLIVNIYGGPGAGKSTAALEITGQLKKQGIKAEYVSEFAKDLVYAKNYEMLDGSIEHQQQIFDIQKSKIDVLENNVDVIVTDSPLLLNSIYTQNNTPENEKKILDIYNDYNNYNIVIKRDKQKPFQQSGRIQNLEQSIEKDKEILNMLNKENLKYDNFDRNSTDKIVDKIIAISKPQIEVQASNDTITESNQLLNSSPETEASYWLSRRAVTPEDIEKKMSVTNKWLNGICYGTGTVKYTVSDKKHDDLFHDLQTLLDIDKTIYKNIVPETLKRMSYIVDVEINTYGKVLPETVALFNKYGFDIKNNQLVMKDAKAAEIEHVDENNDLLNSATDFSSNQLDTLYKNIESEAKLSKSPKNFYIVNKANSLQVLRLSAHFNQSTQRVDINKKYYERTGLTVGSSEIATLTNEDVKELVNNLEKPAIMTSLEYQAFREKQVIDNMNQFAEESKEYEVNIPENIEKNVVSGILIKDIDEEPEEMINAQTQGEQLAEQLQPMEMEM